MADWYQGDIARCIRDDWPIVSAELDVTPPRRGQVFIVTSVSIIEIECQPCQTTHRHVGLGLTGIPGWFWASHFFAKEQPKEEDRKVRREEKV